MARPLVAAVAMALTLAGATACSGYQIPGLTGNLSASQIIALPAQGDYRDLHFTEVGISTDGTVVSSAEGSAMLKPGHGLRITRTYSGKGVAPFTSIWAGGQTYSPAQPGWPHVLWNQQGPMPNGPQMYFPDTWAAYPPATSAGTEGSGIDLAWRVTTMLNQMQKATFVIRQRDSFPLRVDLNDLRAAQAVAMGKKGIPVRTRITFDRANSGVNIAPPPASQRMPPPIGSDVGDVVGTGVRARVLSDVVGYKGPLGPGTQNVVGVEVMFEVDPGYYSGWRPDHMVLTNRRGQQFTSWMGNSGWAPGVVGPVVPGSQYSLLMFWDVGTDPGPPYDLTLQLGDVPMPQYPGKPGSTGALATVSGTVRLR
ncbi:MAG TPA: hypothetical protein VF134_00170 [Candidatus Dormibacteraeota bacterium]